MRIGDLAERGGSAATTMHPTKLRGQALPTVG
jgi:hypothetical protein